ncbi:MAG: restriction endonuclease [Proteobacteria bacterium]|nr:restriction endonuclease [Pseudomonadota bacterium]MCK4830385.1 restriction endonuclease [bacterium]
MPVPDFQSFFKPLLEIATDGKEHSLKEAREKIAEYFNLTDEDRAELLPSGNQTKFDNRVAWAKSYFVQAKVLESPRRAYFKITDRGKKLLAQGHERIDVKVLNQYPEFVEFHTPSKQNKSVPTPSPEEGISETPEEVLQKAYQSIRSDLAGEILERIKSNSPAFFENLVIDLMVAMGYGGSRVDAGQSVGQSGDEGIDGIIKEDRLGLDVIYLQAKRWEGTVGRPEIQKFVGALHGKRAKKGVFITTGKFSEEAHEYVKSIDPKVILIDGRALANYMIDFNLGTSTGVTYEIKRIDSDYFAEE